MTALDHDRDDELDLVVCPECAAPAEVVDRFALPSTDGPLEHATVACLARHRFLLPVSMLPAVDTVAAPTGIARSGKRPPLPRA